MASFGAKGPFHQDFCGGTLAVTNLFAGGKSADKNY